ncbi:VOC family protein [Streptomyces sp. NPDC096132]|uniref:VOC family protein n=1 Tax=Streptomyces sp. NPDC096132 TaxID=3366075 RepID=UPI0037FA0A2A
MRVRGILHYGLQVPSLGVGHDFYSNFGLQVQERDQALTVRCEGREMDQAVLHEGPRKKLRYVAFAVDEGSLADWKKHLESTGTALADAPKGADQSGLWFTDLNGVMVNLREDPLAPWRKALPEEQEFNFGDNIQRVDRPRWQAAGTPASPRRLSHMLMWVPDMAKAEQFYKSRLGLKLSDRIPNKVTFMNSGPGDHHVFGFVQSTHVGLHHSSWEVTNFDQIVNGAQTMADKGHVGWGLGRHTIGSNMFHYIQDPWGSWIEYSADMDRITEAWEPHDYAVPPAVWCPIEPAAFNTNFEQPS